VFGELGNKTYTDYARYIHDSGSNLLGKINDLLEIASMDAVGLALEEGPTSLSDLLSEVVEMHSHTAFMRLQQLKLDCPFPIQLHADRSKLICAISHLVTNALRHSADGSPITISVRVQTDDGVIISVRDAGEGIPTAQLSTILNALAAEDTYYNIECGGIGLGLSLAKELTQRHGGRMMVDSIRHRGTVVSLILPMSRVLSGAPEKKKRREGMRLELVT
jgi:two-component system cell cycle sensor histidine kinase PleC